MKTSLIKGLDDQNKKDVEQNFKESKVIRERLRQVLEGKIEDCRRNSRSKSSYDNPNWAYLQADARGYERALFEVFSLIS